jgi:hypothetical protein
MFWPAIPWKLILVGVLVAGIIWGLCWLVAKGMELQDLKHQITKSEEIIAMQQATIEKLVTNRDRVRIQLENLRAVSLEFENAYRAELAKPPRIQWRTIREEAPPVETQPCEEAAYAALLYLQESGVFDEVSP